MSATKYQIFCRYFQSSSSRAVTNESEVEWVQAEETHNHTDTNKVQPAVTINTKSIEGHENMYIRHEDWSYTAFYGGGQADATATANAQAQALNNKRNAQKLDTQLSAILTQESRSDNPKYDMMFIYDGIADCMSIDPIKSVKYGLATGSGGTPKTDPNDLRTAAHVYYERMKRIDGPAPWFEYATCASLTVAMKKAEELVNIMGKNNVIIGKVVDLKQYIDIE